MQARADGAGAAVPGEGGAEVEALDGGHHLEQRARGDLMGAERRRQALAGAVQREADVGPRDRGQRGGGGLAQDHRGEDGGVGGAGAGHQVVQLLDGEVGQAERGVVLRRLPVQLQGGHRPAGPGVFECRPGGDRGTQVDEGRQDALGVGVRRELAPGPSHELLGEPGVAAVVEVGGQVQGGRRPGPGVPGGPVVPVDSGAAGGGGGGEEQLGPGRVDRAGEAAAGQGVHLALPDFEAPLGVVEVRQGRVRLVEERPQRRGVSLLAEEAERLVHDGAGLPVRRAGGRGRRPGRPAGRGRSAAGRRARASRELGRRELGRREPGRREPGRPGRAGA